MLVSILILLRVSVLPATTKMKVLIALLVVTVGLGEARKCYECDEVSLTLNTESHTMPLVWGGAFGFLGGDVTICRSLC